MNLQLSSILGEVQSISDQYFGDHTLDAISGAGCVEEPKLTLVFINPTHRNISTSKTWRGLKAPWIGCANIWQLFADANIVSTSLNEKIQAAKTNWTEQFAMQVYESMAQQSVYITNIVKWAGLDAALPEREKIKLYTPLLLDELNAIESDIVVAFGQLTYDALMRGLNISGYPSFRDANETMLSTNLVNGVDTKIGKVIPCYFPVGQGIKNRPKALKILRMLAT